MNPKSTDTQPLLRLPHSTGRLAFVPSIICVTAFTLVTLIMIWVSQATTRVYTQGADALTIRAVLRTNAIESDAKRLAERIKARVPEMEVELINEAMGRSLLSLQEPWIAQMPDFEVTPLPILLEMRHPKLLTQPQEVSKFVADLGAEPEVDFVAYNETAHDRLVKLADGTASIENHAIWWIMGSLAMAGFAAQFAFCRMRNNHSGFGAMIFAVVTWAAGCTLGAISYRLWETGALDTGDWHRISASSYIMVAVAAFGIIGAATMLSFLLVNRRL